MSRIAIAFIAGAYGSDGQEGWSLNQVRTTLKPWGGYMVYNNSDTQKTISLTPMNMPKSLAKGNADLADGWRLVLTLESDHFYDTGNIIGRSPLASNGLDIYDRPEMPFMADNVSLSMKHADDKAMRFSSDIRSLSQYDGVWELALHTKGDSGPINWSAALRGEHPEAVRLLVLVTREIYDLLASELPPPTTDYNDEFPTRYKVMAGSIAFVEKAVRDAITALPTEFSLSQNYPNPFNPTTKLAFNLARPGEIKLSVYNLLGQEIVILAEGLWDMGAYEVQWSGLDQGGRNLPSGIYIAVMQAEGRLHARKMVPLK